MGLKKPVISVIMPCYNAEKYLEAAVRSFIDNTISRDCELIIVNDGSTDRSGEIIKDLINTYKDYQIRCIDIPNSGVSAARNTGIREVRGEYMAFMDADDLYGKYYLEVLLDGIRKYKADACLCLFATEEKQMTAGKVDALEIKKRDLMDILLYRKKRIALWSILYRTDIMHGCNVFFPENIKYGEDIGFIWDYVLNAARFALSEGRYYYYRPAAGSATSKATWQKTEILDVVGQITEKVREKEPAYADRFVSYMVPRKIIALQKDYAGSGSKEYFKKLKQQNDRKKIWPVARSGQMKVRLAALTYIVSPELFYFVFHHGATGGKASYEK